MACQAVARSLVRLSRSRAEPQLVRPQLSTREATTGHRILSDDGSRGLLIGRLEDPNAGVHRAEGRTGQDQHTVGQQAPQPLGVRHERGSLLVAAKLSRGGCKK